MCALRALMWVAKLTGISAVGRIVRFTLAANLSHMNTALVQRTFITHKVQIPRALITLETISGEAHSLVLSCASFTTELTMLM